eukprot:8720326-Alexandrium_andersonii.AAC.1
MSFRSSVSSSSAMAGPAALNGELPDNPTQVSNLPWRPWPVICTSSSASAIAGTRGGGLEPAASPAPAGPRP